MASLMTTMLVPPVSSSSSLLPYSPKSFISKDPKPLSPVQSLEHSVSCMSLVSHGNEVAKESEDNRDVLRRSLLSLVSSRDQRENGKGGFLHSTPCLISRAEFDAAREKEKPAFRSKSPLKHSVESAPETEEIKGAWVQCFTDDYDLWALEQEHSPAPRQQQHQQNIRRKDTPSLGQYKRKKKKQALTQDLQHSNSRARPFRPQKANKGTSNYQLRQFAEATLGSGSLRKACKLPEGEDVNEWLAVNVVDFYNQINLLYGSITEFCSPQTCPEMKATDEFEYLWQNPPTHPRPTKMSAPQYIETLLTWCQTNIDNETLFPARIGTAFPPKFQSTVRTMFKRLYRIYAHMYCHHYPVVMQLGLEPHLNTGFKHFCLFVEEFGLAGDGKEGKKGSGKAEREFWGPLGDLVESMLRSD